MPGTTDPPAPLSVVGLTPRDGAQGVGFDPDITISFSAPVAANGVLPKLDPAPPGKWSWATPEKLVFHPAGYFPPFSRVRLTLPGGPDGFSSKAGVLLRTTVKSSFVIRPARRSGCSSCWQSSATCPSASLRLRLGSDTRRDDAG